MNFLTRYEFCEVDYNKYEEPVTKLIELLHYTRGRRVLLILVIPRLIS